MPALAGCALALSIATPANPAHSQSGYADHELKYVPTAYNWNRLGTDELIDFNQLQRSEPFPQRDTISSLFAEMAAKLFAGLTKSRPKPDTIWSKARPSNVPTAHHRFIPVDAQRRLSGDPLNSVGGWTRHKLLPSSSGRLLTGFGATPSTFFSRYSLPEVTSQRARFDNVQETGQLRLLAFEIDGNAQFLSTDPQNAHQVTSTPLIRLLPATWTEDRDRDADTLVGGWWGRRIQPRAAAVTAGSGSSFVRPAVARAADGKKVLAVLTTKTGAWYPSNQRLSLRTSTSPTGERHRAEQRLSFAKLPPEWIDVAQPFNLVDIESGQASGEKAFALDKGWLVANSLTVPVGRLGSSSAIEDTGNGVISLIPFIDTGPLWNREVTRLPTANPWSIGAGIGWQITGHTDLRFGVDIPIVDDGSAENEDQRELGVQLRIGTALGH